MSLWTPTRRNDKPTATTTVSCIPHAHTTSSCPTHATQHVQHEASTSLDSRLGEMIFFFYLPGELRHLVQDHDLVGVSLATA